METAPDSSRLRRRRSTKASKNIRSSRRTDVSTRQSRKSIFRRADCPDPTWEAPNSLLFDVLCNTDLPDHDIPDQQAIDAVDVYDCMGKCSSFSSTNVCHGIAFSVLDNLCWLKDSDISAVDSDSQEVTSNDKFIAAVAKQALFEPYDTQCQYSDGSTHTASNGANFRIACKQDVPGFDYCPGDDVNNCPYHAETLEDCIELCSQASPLCHAVSFNPDMLNGYANCYPKSAFNGRDLNPNGDAYVAHTAIINVPDINSSCKQGTIVAADSSQERFQLNCNENRVGNDLDTPFFAKSIQECISACAEFESSDRDDCQAVVFDPKLQEGYQNCWLKSSTGVPSVKHGYITALLTTVPAINSSASKTSPESNDSVSKVWIIGPVLGAIALIALVAAFFLWRRRRHQNQRDSTSQASNISWPVIDRKSMPPDMRYARPGYSAYAPDAQGNSFYPGTMASSTPGGGWQYQQQPFTHDPYYKLGPEELDSAAVSPASKKDPAELHAIQRQEPSELPGSKPQMAGASISSPKNSRFSR